MGPGTVFILILLLKSAACKIGLRCDMIPEGVTAPRFKEDLGRYKIEISGNPDSYVPEEQYTIFLRSVEFSNGSQHKFTHFILSVINEKFERDVESDTSVIGSLQLFGDTLTKFSEDCQNAVIQTDSQPKTEIQILWKAPQKGGGCIKFKATVVESVDTWFSEEGMLSMLLCEESPDNEDTQPKILNHCCTCDEAKYESDHIRTIIKARGISFPNITGKTFAVFRVDSRHHLISMVSMIDPSPDWVLGVSSLELCLRNCTWIESKVLNLYPWDVGTDDGITYLSPNQPSSPRQPIRRLRTNVPNDPRSPFYDIIGNPLKPLARLTLSRQRLYEKACDLASKEDLDDDATCETEDWSLWSPCSVSCGRGVKYKQRRYKHEESKYVCHKKLTERASCEALRKYCPYQRKKVVEDPLCELGPWSEWSSCSATCGKGVQTRDRKYKNRFAAKTCAAGKVDNPLLQQNLECWGEGKCEDYGDKVTGDCPEKPWSDWSPCSVSCGKGYKERYRLSLEFTPRKSRYWPLHTNYKGGSSEEEFDEDDACNNSKETVECFEKHCPDKNRNVSEVVCGLPKDVGACKSNIDRWYFDTLKGECEIFSYSGCDGNLNNFNTLEQCQTLCSKYQKELLAKSELKKKELGVAVSSVLTYNIQNDANGNRCALPLIIGMTPKQHKRDKIVREPKSNCEVSKWSNWSTCETTANCGIGFKEKYRFIVSYPRNGGKACPKRLLKRKECRVPCEKDTMKKIQYHLD